MLLIIVTTLTVTRVALHFASIHGRKSGRAEAYPEGLVGDNVWSLLGKGSREGVRPSLEKNEFFTRNGVLLNSEQYF